MILSWTFCSKGFGLVSVVQERPISLPFQFLHYMKIGNSIKDIPKPNHSRIAQLLPADVIRLWEMGLGIWPSVSWLGGFVCLFWFKSFLGQNRAASFMQG